MQYILTRGLHTVCPGSSDPILYRKLLYKTGHYFLDIQYKNQWIRIHLCPWIRIHRYKFLSGVFELKTVAYLYLEINFLILLTWIRIKNLKRTRY